MRLYGRFPRGWYATMRGRQSQLQRCQYLRRQRGLHSQSNVRGLQLRLRIGEPRKFTLNIFYKQYCSNSQEKIATSRFFYRLIYFYYFTSIDFDIDRYFKSIDIFLFKNFQGLFFISFLFLRVALI